MESWILDLGLQRSIPNSRIAILPQYSLSFALKENRPYFGKELSAFQSPPVRYALVAALVKFAFAGKAAVRVLEVGAWAGASAVTVGSAIQELGISSCEIVCVDLWEKYFGEEDTSLHYKVMDAAAITGRIQDLFKHNIRVCGLEGMVQVMKAGSRQVLPLFASESFDMVYIDGSHKKNDVLYDLLQAKRLVRSGGVICGDDLELQRSQVDPETHRSALANDADFVTDPKSGAGYHPGVTDAIAEMFNDVWHEHGLWCVERSGETWSKPTFHPVNLKIPLHLQSAVEIPYGIFSGYEIFQVGDGFVAYPIDDTRWFQNHIVESSLEGLVLLLDSIQRQPPIVSEAISTELVVEGFCGYNILRHNGTWWGFDQAMGPLDISSLGESAIEDMKLNGSCVSGEDIADVKAEILAIVILKTDQRNRALQDELNSLKQQMEQRDLPLQEE